MSFNIYSTDPSLTYGNISAALKTLSDDIVGDVLEVPDHKMEQLREQSSSDDQYREQLITYWMMTHPIPTWEDLGGELYYSEEDRALEEVKKHLPKKLGMLLISDAWSCYNYSVD